MTFEGKYRVAELLGSGGFARVYLAEQIDLGRPVAIKVLSPRVARAVSNDNTDPQFEAVAIRFEREARVVSQLRSPQTITMYDYGRTDSGLLYMVMEYIDGVELDEVDVPIEPRRVVNILKQVLQSLQEAHANDLLHRDLKPANIMLYEHLGKKDQVKLLDFGIAKTLGRASRENQKDLTAADTLIGTPRYMSPEQIRGDEIGPASDIYSLGLVIYELLVGEKAITNSDSIEILGQHLSSQTFEIPRSHAVHPKLRRLINKMLVKQVAERYATTSEVLADLAELEKVEGDLTAEAIPAPEVPEPQPVVVPDVDSSDEPAESSTDKPPKTGLIAAAAVVLLVAAGVGIWQLAGGQADSEPREVREIAEASDEQARADEAAAEEEPEKVVTLLRTRPKGASVWVGDRLMGMAPVQFDSDEHEFPLTVSATIGEERVERTLEEPGGEIWIEFIEPEELAEEQEERGEDSAGKDPEPRAQKRREPPAAKKPDPSPKPKQAQPEPQQADPEPPATGDQEQQPEPESGEEAEPAQKEKDVDTRKYLPLE